MSNREIIEWLKKRAETMPMPGARKMYEAAVRALEAQQDMIRRQDVIEELMTWEGHCITDQEEWHLRQVIGSIKSIPGGAKMTPKERQLWYWRKEMESCHKRMKVYKKGTEKYNHWKERYESAVKTFNELSGMNLEVKQY